MMKRYLLSIILGLLTMANISYGQLEINFSSQTANANGTVDIDVTTNGFTNISVLQFSAGWDSLVMTFNSVTFTNPALPDLNTSSISGPMGASNVDPGQFSFSYGSPTGDGNLDDGDVLFTVRFDLVGDECDETTIVLTGDPANIEAFDADFTELSVSSQSGDIMINGSDCGGGGGDDLTVTAATVTANVSSNVCVPLNVENFTGVQAGSGTILWDETIISYTGLSNINLGGLAGSLNETNVSNGELKFVWSNPDPANPLSLADGSGIFDICFDAVGPVGTMSPITLSTQGSLGFEWTDDNDAVIPQSLVNGKVTITQPMGDPVIFNVSDATVNIEQTTSVCVDISVENFNNVLSTQYVITWDASILSNATPTNFNLDGLNASSFNIDGNCATLSWSGINGIDVADGTQIYSMCFDAIGPCDSSSPVDLISKGSTNIEIVDGNTDVISDVSINAGNISLVCSGGEVVCNVVSIDKTCVGEMGGNVNMSVMPDDGCTYSWANSSGVEISTDRNLLGVAAGTYIFTATCDGVEACMQTVTVENFDEVVITDNITNAGCGDLGAISVNVTMGSGNYSYNWSPSQGDTPNIMNLEPGTFLLTVTDNINNCTKTASYEVVNEVDPLEISNSIITDESCIQDDGKISLTISGGCEPYNFAWSDPEIENTPNAIDLSEGTYMVTVTDGSVPANSVTASFTVDGSDPIIESGAAVIAGSSGADGTITIMISGGTPVYSYAWSGPTTGLPNSSSITGLAPGTYSVVVTDSNGCQESFSYIVNDTGATLPEVGDISSEDNENGFALICNGDANGVIVGVIEAGVFPMTVELSGDESRTFTEDAPGTFRIENLAAGTYSVSVTNSFGSVSEENITITEPDVMVTDVSSGCDSEDQCDGFIDLNASGGFGALSYDWGDADLVGGSLNDLCKGSYAALITDENGCELMAMVEIESCEGPDPIGCYLVRNVITPNGDGMNDQFAVTCINDFPSSLEVYDRWGKLVFNQDAYDGTWMGVSNSNEELPEGGYMYIINIDFGQGDREIMKGTLTLLRN